MLPKAYKSVALQMMHFESFLAIYDYNMFYAHNWMSKIAHVSIDFLDPNLRSRVYNIIIIFPISKFFPARVPHCVKIIYLDGYVIAVVDSLK